MYRKHRAFLSGVVIVTVLACGLAASSSAQEGGPVVRNLTNSGDIAEDGYAWSPDGTKIAFRTGTFRDIGDLYVMNVDGSQRRKLAGRSSAMPSWSPDGTRIAFSSSVQYVEGQIIGRDADIYVIDVDGSNLRNLTRWPAEYTGTRNVLIPQVSDVYPTWSPDGTKIAYIGGIDGSGSLELQGQGLVVMNADGSNPTILQGGIDSSDRTTDIFTPWTEISAVPNQDARPIWSPDGEKIAFVFISTKRRIVWVRDPFGPNGRRRTIELLEQGRFACVIDADGTNLRRLTEHIDFGGGPGTNFPYAITTTNISLGGAWGSWSPDSTKFAFHVVAGRQSTRQDTSIYVVDAADGSNPVELTEGIDRDPVVGLLSQAPTYSPDGARIAFLRAIPPGSYGDLWVMNADGSNPRQLPIPPTSAVRASGALPLWSPDGTQILYFYGGGGGRFGPRVADLYTIQVGEGEGGQTGEHGNTRDQATEVGLDSTTPGALEQAGDVDYFRVDVTQAGRLTVGTRGATNTVGYLQNQEGRHLAGNDDAGPEGNFEIVREVGPGTYYVAVVGGAGRTVTGPYTLQVGFTARPAADHGNTRAQAAPVGVNTRTSAALERAGDVDYFRVEITQAGSLTIETTGDTDTFGYVGGASGGWLAQNDDGGTGSNFRITRDVAAGTYYVAVVGYNRTATGAYTLAVRFTGSGGGGGGEGPVEHGNSRAQATRVGVDTGTAGALERAGDIDYFRIEVPAAGQLRVATSGDTDTFGYFGGATGGWLSQNDDNGSDVNFRIVRQVTAGTYYVAVVGGEGRTVTGAYTFHVGFTAAGTVVDHGDTRERAARVGVNTQTEGALERAGDVDYFRVEITQAGRLVVETTGATDTYGYLRDGTGAELGRNDDGGTGRNFRIALDVAAGTYYVAVVGYNRTATGPYTLAVRFE